MRCARSKAGTPVGDVCRQLGVSEATFYAWKKKYAHLGVSELRRLRQVQGEDNRLKRLVADLTLDKHMLSEALRKTPEARASAGARRMVPDPRARARAAPVGYLRIWVLLRREGWVVNRKRVRRLYRLDGLQVRMRVRRPKHMASAPRTRAGAHRAERAVEHGFCA